MMFGVGWCGGRGSGRPPPSLADYHLFSKLNPLFSLILESFLSHTL